MKVSFDNQRQQTFTALRYTNDNAANKVKRIIKEAAGTDNPITYSQEHSSAKNLQTWFDHYIVEPLKKIDGDVLFDGENLYCSWLGQDGKYYRLKALFDKSPRISKPNGNVILYPVENPLHIPPQGPINSPIKRAVKNLADKWFPQYDINSEPVLRKPVNTVAIPYKQLQNKQNTVGRELEIAPACLRPFITCREILLNKDILKFKA